MEVLWTHYGLIKNKVHKRYLLDSNIVRLNRRKNQKRRLISNQI